ncbi:AAA family ATPase, partial [bacterium]|nr:AAA family ATPase [bacterium]
PEQTKKHIRSLCRQYVAQVPRGEKNSLIFFFKGPSGTGKTMTAKAIAKELKKSVLRVTPNDLSHSVLPLMMTYFSEQAKTHNQVLLFDECEAILWSNPFTGKSDGWAKILFEKFQGIAIFTTNYSEPYGFERRMDYVVEFKAPNAKVRERILQQELSALREKKIVSGIPSLNEVSKLATKYPIPGGYYRGALKLAAANSLKDGKTLPELSVPAIEEAFDHASKGFEHGRDEVHEPRLQLNEIALEPETQHSVSLFIHYAKEQLNTKNHSLLLPQGATALFLGPPGTGKTITAEAIAHELQMPFRRVSPSTFMTMWFGETERKIKQVFKEAQSERYVLFIDEAEGLFADRQGDISNTRTTIVNELLQQVESFKGVLIIATNFTQMMDSAFARRFVFHVKFS